MRILITYHGPLKSSAVGNYVHDLASELIARGHQTRCLVVDSRPTKSEAFPVRRIVCRTHARTADLPFDIPCFGAEARTAQTFAALTDAQLSVYRDRIRQALDEEVHQFNPHLIHVQHVWNQGQLVVETGVPFVTSAWGPELLDAQADPRYRSLAQQAADNAGRILVGSAALERRVSAMFEAVEQKTARIRLAVGVNRLRTRRLSRTSALRRLRLPVDAGPLLVVIEPAHLPDAGIEVLLNAAVRYESAAGNPVTLVVGWASAHHSEWQVQARKLGLKRTYFLEEPAPGSRDALLQHAQLLVVPDRAPRCGLTVVESLAAGTPVVTTDASETGELLRGEFGAVVPAGDPKILANAIVQAIREDWKSTKGPAAAQHAYACHDLAKTLSELTAIYEDVYRERVGRLPM